MYDKPQNKFFEAYMTGLNLNPYFPEGEKGTFRSCMEVQGYFQAAGLQNLFFSSFDFGKRMEFLLNTEHQRPVSGRKTMKL